MKKLFKILFIPIFLGVLMFNFSESDKTNNAYLSLKNVEISTALAQLAGEGCLFSAGYCISATGCEISGTVSSSDVWFWQFNGCNPSCRLGGTHCCYTLNYTGCTG